MRHRAGPGAVPPYAALGASEGCGVVFDGKGSGGRLAHEGEHIAVEVPPLNALARLADAGTLPDMKALMPAHAPCHRPPDVLAR